MRSSQRNRRNHCEPTTLVRFVIAEYVTTCHTNDDFWELTTFEASDTLDGSLPMQIY